MNFKNCVLKNVSQDPINFNNPIFFEVTNYTVQVPRFGGVDFENCTINYTANIPFLSIFENAATSDGLGNVSGNFFVISPNDNGFETGMTPNNVSINYQYFVQAPTNEISISSSQNQYLENGAVPMSYQLSRTTNSSIPLAVNLDVSGNALYGTDYDYHQNFTILPFGVNQINTTIGIVDDTVEEVSENVILTIADNPCYTISSNNQVSLTILDDDLLSVNEENLVDLHVYPNPTSKEVFINLSIQDIENLEILIHDITGKTIQQSYQKIQPNTLTIDVSNLAAGLYIISGKNNKGKIFQQKLIIN